MSWRGGSIAVTWVWRRLGLVELLSEAIQQQVRDGKIAVQVAMKFLVPVARQSGSASAFSQS